MRESLGGLGRICDVRDVGAKHEERLQGLGGDRVDRVLVAQERVRGASWSAKTNLAVDQVETASRLIESQV